MQLQHDKKETSWEKHGYVSVRSERGELARCDDYQHNKQYAKREAMTQDLLRKVKAALAAEPAKDAPADSAVKRPGFVQRLAGMFRRRSSEPKAAAAAA